MLSHLKTLFKHSSTTIQLTALIGFQTSWRRRSARRTSASVPRRFVRYETNLSVHGSFRGERSHTNTSSYHHNYYSFAFSNSRLESYGWSAEALTKLWVMKLHDDTAFSRLGLSYGVDRSCVIEIFNAIINYAFVHDPDLRLQRNLDNAVWVVSF